VCDFTEIRTGSNQLRPYQAKAIEAVISSIMHRRGLEFVWIFPR
jgi:superfamily II DNA or RNA helicase